MDSIVKKFLSCLSCDDQIKSEYHREIQLVIDRNNSNNSRKELQKSKSNLNGPNDNSKKFKNKSFNKEINLLSNPKAINNNIYENHTKDSYKDIDLKNSTNNESKIKKLNDELNLKHNEILNLKNQIQNINKINESKIKNSNDELNLKNNEILNLKNQIQNITKINENRIRELSKELNLKNSEITQLKSQFQNNNTNEINILKNELKNSQQKIKELELKILTLSKVPIIRGLNNIGATCYMNATLQCLSNTKELTDYFKDKYINKSNNKMANEYHQLIINLWDRSKNNTPFSPYSFKKALSEENPLFAGVAANDSKDLINFLLERFHKELNPPTQNKAISNSNVQQDQTNESKMLNLFLQELQTQYNSPISNLFYGVLETKSQCHGCQTIKYNFQIYSFLEFPLQQVNQFCFNNGKRPLYNNNGTNPDIDLYECFEYYGKVDLMTGENQMFCNICKKLHNAFYSTIIYSGPNNLIINLNRGKGAVYECKVNFPEQLNIIQYVTFKTGVTVYELYAVICHLGPSSMSGHFVAYCKNIIDNKWYLYNDGLVSKCTKNEEYRNGMPYILFYKVLKSS